MAITTNDFIYKFGTQDSVDDGSTSTVANDAFSVLADITAWTNTDDAPFASFVLKCQFDTAMPTVGAIDLFARLLNVDTTNEPNAPDANYPFELIGTFPIDFGVAADTDFYTTINNAVLPAQKSQQEYEFYIRNRGTGQTIGINWTLKVTPVAYGPV